MNYKNNILRNTFFSSIHIYTEYAFGLISSIIIARSLNIDDYGIYTLLIWVSASSIILINGGLNAGQIKFVAQLKTTHGDSYAVCALKYFRKIQTIKTIAVISLAILLKSFILNKFSLNEYSTYYWIILIAVAFRGRYMFYVSSAKGFEQFDKLSKISLIVTPINLLLVVLAALFGSFINIFIYIYLITGIAFYIVSKLIINPYLKHDSNEILDKSHLIRINKYLKITSITIILSYFVSKELEIFLLGWLSEPADAGMFRIAMTLSSSILLMVPGVFSSVLLPTMSSSLATSNKLAGSRYFYSTRILIILSIPLAILVSYLADNLVVVMYGNEYKEAGTALAICILAISITSIASSAQSYLLSAEKQNILLVLLCISLLLKIIVGYFLILNYQLVGAALTYLFTIVFSYITRIYLACQYLNTGFPIKTLLKCILLSMFCLVPLVLIGEKFSNYVSLVLFSIIYGILFIILSIITKLWSKDDIIMFESLTKRIPNTLIQEIIFKFLSYGKHYK